MRKLTRRAGILPALVAGMAVLSGCELEVLNPGAIQDDDLNDPTLMPIVVAGVSFEFNDFYDDYAFDIAVLTDDMAGTGSYFATGQNRLGRFDNEDSEGHWEQIHEAAWSADQAWIRLQDVLGEEADNSPDAAKLFALMGHAHRTLGEAFCKVVYNGHIDDPAIGGVQPRTAAFDSAIAAFNQAISIGGAAGSSADEWVMLARAGMAMSYVGKGDLATAASWAAQVPTDFVHEAIYDLVADNNLIWQETHGRAEIGVASTAAEIWGSADLDPDGIADPRTPYTVCGVYDAGSDENVSTGDCAGSGSGAHQGADGLTAHIRQDKLPEIGSNIPFAHGTEMRLIEAENALVNGDLAAFIGFVNEVRDFHELATYATPATAGSLEYPNVLTTVSMTDASVDAWSILDKERYQTMWLEGRRWFDLNRWDHPFLAGGTVIGAPAENPRASCMLIPQIECQLNSNLTASDCETT